MPKSVISQGNRGFFRFLITLFIGLLFVGCVNFGIQAFYPAPTEPTPIATPLPMDNYVGQTNADNASTTANQTYQNSLATYQRNISTLSLVLAIAILVLAITVLQDLMIIADGLLLGGIFTLGYSILQANTANSPKFLFSVVLISLVIAVGLAYIKFAEPTRGKK